MTGRPRREAHPPVVEQIAREDVRPVRRRGPHRTQLLPQRVARRQNVLRGEPLDRLGIGNAAESECRLLRERQVQHPGAGALEAVEMGVEAPVQQYLTRAHPTAAEGSALFVAA